MNWPEHVRLRRAVVAVWLLTSGVAIGQTGLVDDTVRAKARVLAYAGVEAYAVDDYDLASEKLEEAYRLLPVPSLGLWSARSLVRLGKLVEAEARYRAVSGLPIAPSDPPVQQAAKQDAARELQQLLPKIPSLKLELSGATAADVEVELDGVRLSRIDLGQVRLLNPGRHNVVGMRGSEKSEVILNLGEGAHEEVWLRFSAEPPAAEPVPSPAVVQGNRAPEDGEAHGVLRSAGWIALAAGGTGLVTGIAAYFVGRNIHGDFERRNSCANGACTQAEVDTYNTWRTLHIAGLISGSVLGAAGMSILVFTPRDSPPVERSISVVLELGPGSMAVHGQF